MNRFFFSTLLNVPPWLCVFLLRMLGHFQQLCINSCFIKFLYSTGSAKHSQCFRGECRGTSDGRILAIKKDMWSPIKLSVSRLISVILVVLCWLRRSLFRENTLPYSETYFFLKISWTENHRGKILISTSFSWQKNETSGWFAIQGLKKISKWLKISPCRNLILSIIIGISAAHVAPLKLHWG